MAGEGIDCNCQCQRGISGQRCHGEACIFLVGEVNLFSHQQVYNYVDGKKQYQWYEYFHNGVYIGKEKLSLACEYAEYRKG